MQQGHPHPYSRLWRAAASFAVLVAVTLSGCTTVEAGTPSDGVTGTTWSGVDSLERPTTFTFEGDGTVEVTYFDDTFNDELDTWTLIDSTVTVTVYLSEELGSALYTGILNLGTSTSMGTGTETGAGTDAGTSSAPATMTLSATTTLSDETYELTLTRD
jgi:hypothetical protein